MLSRRLLRVKVVKSVYSHVQNEGATIAASEKELVKAIDSAYNLYFHLLSLIPHLARYAEERIEIGLNKKLPTYEDLHPNRKFAENSLIARLDASEALAEECKRRKLSWKGCDDLVRSLYNTLTQQEFYRKYMESSERSFKEDAALVSAIFMNMLEENEELEAVLEEQSLWWGDDLGFILTMASRTVLGVRESHSDIKLMEKFKSDEDLDYAKRLLRDSLAGYERISTLIDRTMNNWDIERVALMDNIILVVAIAEAESFASIPTRVTLNEYIDIAKFYSTDSSSSFINGVLDRVLTTLTDEGKIVKSGKGLL